MTAAATVIHAVGSRVWVKDDKESWVKAEVQKIEQDVLIVALEDGGELRKVNPEEAPLQNVDTRGVEVSWPLDAVHCCSADCKTTAQPTSNCFLPGHDPSIVPPRTRSALEHQVQVYV